MLFINKVAPVSILSLEVLEGKCFLAPAVSNDLGLKFVSTHTFCVTMAHMK